MADPQQDPGYEGKTFPEDDTDAGLEHADVEDIDEDDPKAEAT